MRYPLTIGARTSMNETLAKMVLNSGFLQTLFQVPNKDALEINCTSVRLEYFQRKPCILLYWNTNLSYYRETQSTN